MQVIPTWLLLKVSVFLCEMTQISSRDSKGKEERIRSDGRQVLFFFEGYKVAFLTYSVSSNHFL